MTRKKILSLLLCFALTMGLVACSSDTVEEQTPTTTDAPSVSENTSQEPEDTATAVHVNVGENYGFDLFHPICTPSNTSSGYGFTYYAINSYDTLVTYDANGNLVGSLAKDWDVSEDGTVYTFYLNEGIQFSDGSDLTAEDVAKSLLSVPITLDIYNGTYGMLSTIIKDAVVVDDYTVELQLTQAYYSTLIDLCLPNPFGIVSSEQLNDDLTIKESFYTGTYGTGPYMYEGDTDGQTYNFVLNPYYWGETPDVTSFSVKVISDNNAMLLALKNNEIDVMYGITKISAETYTEINDMANFTALIDDNSLQTYYIGYNMNNEIFGDQAVREAISTAIDKDVINNDIYSGIRAGADTFFSTSLPYCDVSQTVYDYSIETANAILDAAGYLDTDGDGIREMNGVKMEANYLYQTASASDDYLVLYICDQLKQIGISLTPSSAEIMDWYSMIMTGDYGMTNFQTQGGYYDPTGVVTNMDPATSMDPIMMQMSMFLPGGTDLIVEVNTSADENRIAEIYEVIIDTMSDVCFTTPLYYTRQIILMDDDFDGYIFEQDANYFAAQNLVVK